MNFVIGIGLVYHSVDYSSYGDRKDFRPVKDTLELFRKGILRKRRPVIVWLTNLCYVRMRLPQNDKARFRGNDNVIM